MRIDNPIEARAFIAECIAQGHQVPGLNPWMTEEEWLRVAMSMWKRLHQERRRDNVIKFPVRKKTLYSVRN